MTLYETANCKYGFTRNTSDFIEHTGDVVDYAKYKSFWKEMLDTNFRYLSKMPVMAISGNHETTYQSRIKNRKRS